MGSMARLSGASPGGHAGAIADGHRRAVHRGRLVGLAAAALVAAAAGCGGGSDPGSDAADKLFSADIPANITVTSPGFEEGSTLPDRFTCDGTNISPSLRWSGVPEGTAELAVVVDDPDASGGTYVHWVVVAIPPATPGLAEDSVPDGAKQTRQSEDRDRWRGPCPPKGKAAHTYRFSVYALSEPVPGSVGGDTKLSTALDDIRERAKGKGVVSATFGR
jgi:Raf kinase inhibitor-like YbhB/YbcL family protein